MSNVSRLILEDEVIAVVSGTSSGASVAEIPVCQENETPCISMASAKSITTDTKNGGEYKWMFKTPQTNGHAGEWQAEYLKAKGVANVCILYTNDGYGKDSLANYKAMVEAQGLTVAYEGNYAATDTEFSAQMAGLQASGCGAVIIGSTPPVASLVTIAVRTALPDLIISSGHGICNQAYITTAGQAAEGVVFPCGKITVLDQLADSGPDEAGGVQVRRRLHRLHRRRSGEHLRRLFAGRPFHDRGGAEQPEGRDVGRRSARCCPGLPGNPDRQLAGRERGVQLHAR